MVSVHSVIGTQHKTRTNVVVKSPIAVVIVLNSPFIDKIPVIECFNIRSPGDASCLFELFSGTILRSHEIYFGSKLTQLTYGK